MAMVDEAQPPRLQFSCICVITRAVRWTFREKILILGCCCLDIKKWSKLQWPLSRMKYLWSYQFRVFKSKLILLHLLWGSSTIGRRCQSGTRWRSRVPFTAFEEGARNASEPQPGEGREQQWFWMQFVRVNYKFDLSLVGFEFFFKARIFETF